MMITIMKVVIFVISLLIVSVIFMLDLFPGQPPWQITQNKCLFGILIMLGVIAYFKAIE